MLNTFVSKDSKLPLVCAIAHGGLTRDHKGTMAKMAQRGEAEEEEQLSMSQSWRQVKDWSHRSLSLPSLWSARRKVPKLPPGSLEKMTKASAGGALKKAKPGVCCRCG